MEKDNTVYLRHVLDAINTIEEYLQGVNEDNFKATRLLQDGAIRQIEIIGEAIRHISKDIRKTYPEIPWQDMAGMRDSSFMTTSVSTLKRFGIRRRKIFLS